RAVVPRSYSETGRHPGKRTASARVASQGRKTSGVPGRSGAMRPVSDLQRSVAPFKVITDMVPAGDQPRAIGEMEHGIRAGTTDSLLRGRVTIVVASVSCIYGLCTPQEYVDRMLKLRVGAGIERDALLRKLVGMQYVRNDLSFSRGTFRVRGDTIEIIPVYEELAVRIEMFGDEIERLMTLHPLTGEVISEDEELYVFPASHYVAGPERME